MSKKVSKVNVTSMFGDWWMSDLSDLFVKPDKVQIIGTVVNEGTLYLIYTYDDEDFK